MTRDSIVDNGKLEIPRPTHFLKFLVCTTSLARVIVLSRIPPDMRPGGNVPKVSNVRGGFFCFSLTRAHVCGRQEERKTKTHTLSTRGCSFGYERVALHARYTIYTTSRKAPNASTRLTEAMT